jgi:hypothetical protein
MPRNNHTLSPSQTRTRIRSAIRSVNQRGGVSLRVLYPDIQPSFTIASLDVFERAETKAIYRAQSSGQINNVTLISTALENEAMRLVDRLWHIAILKGNDLSTARVYDVWIGNHNISPIIVRNFASGWLYNADTLTPKSVGVFLLQKKV